MQHKQVKTKIFFSLFYYYVFEEIKSISGAFAERKIDAIKEAFLFITDDPSLALEFRCCLRSLKINNLETILFGNDQDAIVSHLPQYEFPDDETIKDNFVQLNSHYMFFPQSDNKKFIEHFYKLFYACKLTADYIEKNNDANNGVAYLHAYKIMALFPLPQKGSNIFTPFQNCISQNFLDNRHPIHDSLINDIPVNDPFIKDLIGWHNLIKQYGKNAIEFFQSAQQIETHNNGKAPANIIEARQIAGKLTYQRYDEYPELALLCKHYRVKEAIFDQCLELEKIRKKSDNIPDHLINGSDFGCKGYYLVKLPIDDPRAYILGRITNCCQSIGGHSEKCVIDGLTLSNNGFYVLLKGNPQELPILNGKINYQHYSIVGQSYVWLSQDQNFVFDSWENLRPNIDDKNITILLPELAKLIAKNSKDIVRVTIGNGGKTPQDLVTVNVHNPEIMLEGYQYHDSDSQALIYLDDEKARKIFKDIRNEWNMLVEKPFNISEKDFFNFIQKNISSSFVQANKIKELFLLGPIFWNLLPEESIKLLLSSELSIHMMRVLYLLRQNKLLHHHFPEVIKIKKEIDENHFNLYSILLNMQDEKILTKENVETLLCTDPYDSPNATAQCLIFLNKINKLTDQHRDLLKLHSKYSSYIYSALLKLNKKGKLSDSNIENIFSHSKYIKFIVFIYSQLKDFNCFTDEYIDKLFTLSEYAESINKALKEFINRNISEKYFVDIIMANGESAKHAVVIKEGIVELITSNILTDKNISYIISCPEYANVISKALVELKRSNMLSDEYIQACISSPKHAMDIANVLTTLKQSRISPDKYIQNVVINASYAKYIYSIFSDLAYYAKIDFDDIADAVISHGNYAKRISEAFRNNRQLEQLYKNIKMIYSQIQYADSILDILSELEHTSLRLTDEQFTLLCTNAQYAHYVRKAICFLKGHYRMLNEDNLQLILSHPEHSDFLAKGIYILKVHNILTDLNFQSLLIRPEFAEPLAQSLYDLNKNNILKDRDRYVKILLSQPNYMKPLTEAFIKLSRHYMLDDNHITMLLSFHPSHALLVSKVIVNFNNVSRTTIEAILLHPENAADNTDSFCKLCSNFIFQSFPFDLAKLEILFQAVLKNSGDFKPFLKALDKISDHLEHDQYINLLSSNYVYQILNCYIQISSNSDINSNSQLTCHGIFSSNYNKKYDGLIQEINLQIDAIKKDGNYSDYTDHWFKKDNRYFQKWFVLEMLKFYLNGQLERSTLDSILEIFILYDKGGILRSSTGKLVDRVIEVILSPSLEKENSESANPSSTINEQQLTRNPSISTTTTTTTIPTRTASTSSNTKLFEGRFDRRDQAEMGGRSIAKKERPSKQ